PTHSHLPPFPTRRSSDLGSASRQPRDPPSWAHLRHQQDPEAFQGPSGLIRVVQPRAVIFDVGKVLFDWEPRLLYERHLADIEDRSEEHTSELQSRRDLVC